MIWTDYMKCRRIYDKLEERGEKREEERATSLQTAPKLSNGCKMNSYKFNGRMRKRMKN